MAPQHYGLLGTGHGFDDDDDEDDGGGGGDDADD